MPSFNPPIPLNARTVIYCFLMGLVLSAPLGMFPEGHLLFEPPSAAKRICLTSVSASYFLLPFWALFSMRKHPLLRLRPVRVKRFHVHLASVCSGDHF